MHPSDQQPTIYAQSAVDAMPNELLGRILEDLTWNQLVKVSWVHGRIKAIVRDIVSKRVYKFLGIFVDISQVPLFLEILHDAAAGIAGGLVRCIMSPAADRLLCKATPHTMDVIFPFDKGGTGIHSMHRLLVGMGYADEISHLSANECEQFSSKYIVMEHKGKDRSICLIEALPHKSVLDMVVENQHTSSMYLLTSTRMYCLFPELHAKKRNLILTTPLDPWIRSLHIYNFGIITLNSTKYWGKPCGVHCPARWRQTEGLEGVSVFGWKAAVHRAAADSATNEAADINSFDIDQRYRSDYWAISSGSNLDDPLGKFEAMWRLSAGSVECANTLCRYKGQGIDA